MYHLECLPSRQSLAVCAEQNRKVRCPLHWAFFGLTSKYLQNVTYEQIFFLQHHGKFSFFEAYNLPIGLRDWFVEKNVNLIQQRNKE